MKTQDEYLNRLREIALTPLGVTKEFLDNIKFSPGKVRPYIEGKGPHDHRTVLPNEIIIEFDGSYAHNVKLKKTIEPVLDERRIPYYTFYSGGKSFHIHMFFNQIN